MKRDSYWEEFIKSKLSLAEDKSTTQNFRNRKIAIQRKRRKSLLRFSFDGAWIIQEITNIP